MSSRTPPVTIGRAWLRRRLIWSVIFVVISLGGAGLASAIDRPHSQQLRPELGWTADQRAELWFEQLLAGLREIESSVVALSAAGRSVLAALSTPRPAELGMLLPGEQASADLVRSLAEIERLRADEPDGAESWRLGEARREWLAAIDAAVESCRSLDDAWTEMNIAARAGGRLLVAIQRHDQLALDALAAGRDARWSAAVELLEQALPELDEAAGAAAELRSPLELPQTNDLLARQREHDEALLALYGLLEEGVSLDDPRAEALRSRVEAVRLPLPTSRETIQAVIGETALPELTAALGAFEEARGLVADALAPPQQELDE